MADEIEAILSVEVPLRLLAAGATEGARSRPDPDRHARLRAGRRFAPPRPRRRSRRRGSSSSRWKGPSRRYSRGAEHLRSEARLPLGRFDRAGRQSRRPPRLRRRSDLVGRARTAATRRASLLFGFSQPCSFNYRLALAPPHGVPFRAIAAICGGIPGEWTSNEPGTAASRETHVLHVSTREDEIYALDKVAHYRERLASRFRSAAHRLYDGGHRVPSAAAGDVRAFFAAHA